MNTNEQPKKRRGPSTNIQLDGKRNLFKECRNNIGSAREVGLIFGVTESAVRKIEDGISTPNLLNAFKYSLLFKRPLEDLFPDLLSIAVDNVGQHLETME